MGVPAGPVLATVVPVYNEAVHVEGCLRSLLNQSIASDQHMIMVLDGGSTDGTTDVVQRLIDEHQGSSTPSLELVQTPDGPSPMLAIERWSNSPQALST